MDKTSTILHAAVLNAPNCNGRHTSAAQYGKCGFGNTNRCMIAVIVYLALFLDNVLLTVIVKKLLDISENDFPNVFRLKWLSYYFFWMLPTVVPILPDYLVFINNRTINVRASVGSSEVNSNKFPFNPASLMAYRNQNKESRNSIAPTQMAMTKHPIPGKSTVNFTMLPPISDKASYHLPNFEQKHQQPKQQYLTVNGNNSSKDIISIVPSTTTTPSHNLEIHETLRSSLESTSKLLVEDNKKSLNDENGSIGLLLAIKAFVQLIFNPIVGNMSSKFGYRFPIVIGTFCLLIASLVFAVGETYATLLLGRAVQGIGSACIGVCGMSLVAQHYPEEDRRSKIMGIILGSIALGVLIGYPFGGFLYDLSGKSAPFIILSTLLFINLGMQLIVMDLSVQPEVVINIDGQMPKWKPIFESKMILAIILAIWFSTSTMAILEPCLPIWLLQHIKPSKWQLGTVFIPDSVGYFVGTNFFGTMAYKYGQIRISCCSLILVGLSAVMIPNSKTVGELLLPHFCLGLGIGIIDAALVPLLATFVDATLTHDESNESDCDNSHAVSMPSYGTVYCLQQTSVSLAYCLAPLIGGELAEAFGFAWLMRIVGFFNIAYGPILVYLYQKYDPKIIREQHSEMTIINNERSGSQYKQLYNALDTE